MEQKDKDTVMEARRPVVFSPNIFVTYENLIFFLDFVDGAGPVLASFSESCLKSVFFSSFGHDVQSPSKCFNYRSLCRPIKHMGISFVNLRESFDEEEKQP